MYLWSIYDILLPQRRQLRSRPLYLSKLSSETYKYDIVINLSKIVIRYLYALSK